MPNSTLPSTRTHALPARNETRDPLATATWQSLGTQLALLCVEHLRTLIREEVCAALDAQAPRPVLQNREQLACALGVCTKTISNLVARGMPCVQVLGSERYELDKALAWLRTEGARTR